MHGPREFRLQLERLQVVRAPRLEIAVVLGCDVPERNMCAAGNLRIELQRAQRGLPRLAKPLGAGVSTSKTAVSACASERPALAKAKRGSRRNAASKNPIARRMLDASRRSS